jgi:uncharacterized protein (DUF302 family)
MLKKLLFSSLVFSLFAAMAFGAQGIRFNEAQGDKEAQFMEMLDGIEEIGFVLSDPHERINDAYKAKYGTPEIDGKPNEAYDPNFKVALDTLGFFSITNDEVMRELLIEAPQLGGFSPFNLHIYKKVDEDVTYVGHVTPNTMLDIVGVTDEKVRKPFVEQFVGLDEYVDEKIGGKVEFVDYTALPEQPMMNFEVTFERPEDLSEFIDEFQENFEGTFEENGYIIAGYKNFVETYEDRGEDFSKYDAYFVYSLCHFPFSYSIFNAGRPDAGVFAPCSMYMYIEKDSNKMIIGMPRLATWAAVMTITDKTKIEAMDNLDAEIIGIMEELGAKQI